MPTWVVADWKEKVDDSKLAVPVEVGVQCDELEVDCLAFDGTCIEYCDDRMV